VYPLYCDHGVATVAGEVVERDVRIMLPVLLEVVLQSKLEDCIISESVRPVPTEAPEPTPP